ncbi:MAG: ABC transporter permease [Clostridiales bacterium]|nr:ABC transporter permease [Clostridiales bacterium]
MSEGTEKRSGQSLGMRILDALDDDRLSQASLPAVAIILTILAASVLLILLGKNPFIAMASFLRGSGFLPKPAYGGGQNMLTDFLSFMGILAPMMLAALGVIIALKAGMFNIGIAGQMLTAGFLATITIGYSGLSAWIAKPLVILIGMLAGGLMGAAIGFLKYKFNIHEVVSTIMFNYITSYITGFYINTYYTDIISRSSRVCSPASRLSITGVAFGDVRLTLPLGVLLAFAGVFLVRFLLDRTVAGFEMKAVGKNRDCANYAGVNVGRSIVLAMSLSGVFAGLAGVTYYLGYFNTIVPKDLADLGYDSIAVALLGNVSPVGSIFSSILITVFQKGSVYVSSTVGAPKEIASVITGILLLFSACGAYMRYLARRKKEQLAESASEGGRQ